MTRHRFEPSSQPLIAVLIATSLVACVSNPAQGVAPRRARVQIDDNATTVTNFVPGAGYYRERVAWKNWRYLDGKHDIDEQDWWMLTDPAVSTQIKHARDRAERQQTWGWGLAIGGSIAGLAPTVYRPEGGARTAVLGVAVLGSLAITVGSLLIVKGATTMKRRVMPLLRAAEAAEEVVQCFNGRRCRTIESKSAP